MSAFRDHYVSSTLEKQQLPFLVKEMYQRKKKQNHFILVLLKYIYTQVHHMLVGNKTKADVKVCERNTQEREISMKKLADLSHSP